MLHDIGTDGNNIQGSWDTAQSRKRCCSNLFVFWFPLMCLHRRQQTDIQHLTGRAEKKEKSMCLFMLSEHVWCPSDYLNTSWCDRMMLLEHYKQRTSEACSLVRTLSTSPRSQQTSSVSQLSATPPPAGLQRYVRHVCYQPIISIFFC